MATKDRQCPISWPTRRLLMAEIENADGLDDGPYPVNLQECLESVTNGYEPYANFPNDFVAEEIKLLQERYGKLYEAGELLSDRDWQAHKDCDPSKAGEPPLEVQVDYDLAAWLTVMAGNNGIDTERYANNLLEQAVLREGGIGTMVLNRSQVIGERHVDAGTTVEVFQHHGKPGESDRFFKRVVQAPVAVGGEILHTRGVVSLEDLTALEHSADTYEALEQRVRATLEGLRGVVKIERLTSGPTGTEEQAMMVRVETDSVPNSLPIVKALKAAGLTPYRVRESKPPVLHVRA